MGRHRRPHGLGSVYQRGPNNWWVQWTENGRRRHAHGFLTKELAQQVLNQILVNIAAGKAGLAIDPKEIPTLGEHAGPWLERRALTSSDVRNDRLRWNRYLANFFGAMRPNEVDTAKLREFVEAMLKSGLSPATVRLPIYLLSSLYVDLCERGFATTNPVRALPRSIRRLIRSNYDTKKTPFIEKLADVRRVFLFLPEGIRVAFALGVFGGLRTGEILGLTWSDVNLGARRIHVRQQVKDGRLAILKDKESRVAPILDTLRPILAAWQLRSGGKGLLFNPACAERGGTANREPTFVRSHTLHRHLKLAFKACGLPMITWYQATRHTFASQWVLAGGSIEKLSTILGHSSVKVTERYAHLRPDLFPESDYALLGVDLQPGGVVVPLAQDDGKALQ